MHTRTGGQFVTECVYTIESRCTRTGEENCDGAICGFEVVENCNTVWSSGSGSNTSNGNNTGNDSNNGGSANNDDDCQTVNGTPIIGIQPLTGEIGGGCAPNDIIGILPTEDEEFDECSSNNITFNSFYSAYSPFEVDLEFVRVLCESIDITTAQENQKFMCIYNKLIASPKFKRLFVDTFGEASNNLNVKFKLVDDIPGANGKCIVTSGQVNTSTGELISMDIEILIDKGYMDSSSAIAVAKTILHESIHAYLMVKYYGCNQGTPFDSINDVDLSELLNEYNLECAFEQGQHEFMFNFMVPTIAEILADLKDELIPLNHQQAAEGQMFINEENPVVNEITGEYVKDAPWNWNDFHKYMALQGLNESSAFHFEYPNNPPSPGYLNFEDYTETGIASFKKQCND